ncbi:MAG: holo-[acyl-carrier-protein] synthase [Trichlorobacter sp.]|jgi:holo-[acyl-carrier protein] synthase|nr:holo-[acyl-carrier-protein] synthase [Trichlorobacter sp.]
MITGIGIDTVEIARIQKFIDDDNQALLNRLFTANEQQHCFAKKQGAATCLAARFAAKEAFVKALGTGLRNGLSWVEMEVVNNELGKPELLLFGRTSEIFAEVAKRKIHLSLAHDGGNAVAMVVLEQL